VTETFKIYGESESGTIATTVIDIGLSLVVSDLTITELKLKPEEPMPGDRVALTFNIINNFHLPANNFFVRLYKIDDDGEKEVYSKQIASLNANGSEEIKYSWDEPEDSISGYILEAKLFGDIIPRDNNTPVRKKNVILKDKPPEEESSNDLVILILVSAIIIALVIFLTVWLLFQKKKIPTKTDPAKEHRQNKTDNGQIDRIKQQPTKSKSDRARPPPPTHKVPPKHNRGR
jgi:hypothetical protein